MKSTARLICLGAFFATSAQADPPELASWIRNTTGATGFNGLPANVQLVRYSATSVYVSTSDIPSYAIGPWGGNPNSPANQQFVFKIPRNPAANNGTKTKPGLGVIGVWVNGVAVFNPLDARSYNNQNVWHQNAVVVEADGFDACLGHPAPGGVYHHHQNPRCLYQADASRHSPLLGYAYDGFPIYGPYAYAKADGTGGVTRMRSSYRLRSLAQRTTLPDGTPLTPAQYGPTVSASTPLGYYVEDFEYVGGLGDLDSFNGRFGVTPEYPNGTYAYFTTMDAGGASAYPYMIGPEYYGIVATENVTQNAHVSVAEPTTTYGPALSTDANRWILPSSARLTGIGGAFYTTDLTIANTGTAETTFTLKNLGNNQDGRGGAERTFALAAGKSVTYTDVLGSVFGVASGFGALRVGSPSSQLALVSQTSTPGGGGTFGQSVPLASATDLVTAGAPRSILAIREDAAFRTNLILANATEADLTVAVSLVSEAGVALASKSYTLPPLGMTQVTRVVRDLGIDADVAGARLVLSTSTPNGAFAAYAAAIDGVTNDPRTLLPR